MRNIEICYSPDLLYSYNLTDRLVVVVDIFRASTTICSALNHGVQAMIPISDIDEAKKYYDNSYTVAGERDGKKIPFASYGNSPLEFKEEDLKGKTIVYSTTNGTYTIEKAKQAKELIIACFSNHSKVVDYINRQALDVTIICSGFRGDFSLEDAVYAGALAENLMALSSYESSSDALYASIELWKNAQSDIKQFFQKCAHLERLKKLDLGEIINYCIQFDTAEVIPVYRDGKLVRQCKKA